MPLTAAQSAGLAQLINPMNNRGPGMNQVDPSTGLTPGDDALFEQAAQVLSPAQVAILKADRADQNRMNSIMREYLNAGSGGTGTVIMSNR